MEKAVAAAADSDGLGKSDVTRDGRLRPIPERRRRNVERFRHDMQMPTNRQHHTQDARDGVL